jgi:hypothetical protein
MEPRNRFQGMNSASLCSLAGRYDKPVPTRFLAPIDCWKIPAVNSATGFTFLMISQSIIILSDCKQCRVNSRPLCRRRDKIQKKVNTLHNQGIGGIVLIKFRKMTDRSLTLPWWLGRRDKDDRKQNILALFRYTMWKWIDNRCFGRLTIECVSPPVERRLGGEVLGVSLSFTLYFGVATDQTQLIPSPTPPPPKAPLHTHTPAEFISLPTWSPSHGKINYIDTKAKCRHLKKLTCKGTLRQVFIRVYWLQLPSVMLVFLTQLCEQLPL